MAVARFSSVGVAMRCALPRLGMTARLHIMARTSDTNKVAYSKRLERRQRSAASDRDRSLISTMALLFLEWAYTRWPRWRGGAMAWRRTIK